MLALGTSDAPQEAANWMALRAGMDDVMKTSLPGCKLAAQLALLGAVAACNPCLAEEKSRGGQPSAES